MLQHEKLDRGHIHPAALWEYKDATVAWGTRTASVTQPITQSISEGGGMVRRDGHAAQSGVVSMGGSSWCAPSVN